MSEHICACDVPCPCRRLLNEARARVAELEDPHFLKGLQARVDKAESRVNLLGVTEDMYRTVALRHEARIAELEGAVQEWCGARLSFLAMPPLSFNEKGWMADEHTEARNAAFSRLGLAEAKLGSVLNAKEVMPNQSATDTTEPVARAEQHNATPRPAQSPAGAEAMREAILRALPGGTHCDPEPPSKPVSR